MTHFCKEVTIVTMMTYLVWGIFFVWLSFMSWTVYKLRNHYFNLISRTKKEKIDEILDELLQTDKKIGLGLEEVKKELKEEIKRSELHIQKIGLIRFNPFERIGGEQSFVISLLNKENTGILVNLRAR